MQAGLIKRLINIEDIVRWQKIIGQRREVVIKKQTASKLFVILLNSVCLRYLFAHLVLTSAET
jgi:hypothetical protein